MSARCVVATQWQVSPCEPWTEPWTNDLAGVFRLKDEEKDRLEGEEPALERNIVFELASVPGDASLSL